MDQFIPLDNSPLQHFNLPLKIDGTTVNIQVVIRYNEIAGYWVMSLSDSSGKLVLDSIPFVTGNFPASNILSQFAYLGIGSAYIINAGAVPRDYPDDASLGTDFILIWSDTTPV